MITISNRNYTESNCKKFKEIISCSVTDYVKE